LGLLYHQLAGKQVTVDLKQTQLLVAKAYYEESHRIKSKIYGHTNPETVDAASKVAAVSEGLSRLSHHLMVILNNSICSLFVVGS
jgi:hypothetical protein